MTGLSAKRFGLKDRGLVKEGASADLVLFDSESICDKATFDQPIQMCKGIHKVMINGEWSFENGTNSKHGLGKFLSRN